MDTRIREMRPGDIAEALALWSVCPGIGLSQADSPVALGRFLQRNPGLSFVACRGDRLVGSALAGCDGRRGYLYHVAVAPQHRRQGVGRALVQSCLRALAREGIDKSHIMVKADNAEGLVFWTHSGWSPRTDLVLMSRSTSG